MNVQGSAIILMECSDMRSEVRGLYQVAVSARRQLLRNPQDKAVDAGALTCEMNTLPCVNHVSANSEIALLRIASPEVAHRCGL